MSAEVVTPVHINPVLPQVSASLPPVPELGVSGVEAVVEAVERIWRKELRAGGVVTAQHVMQLTLKSMITVATLTEQHKLGAESLALLAVAGARAAIHSNSAWVSALEERLGMSVDKVADMVHNTIVAVQNGGLNMSTVSEATLNALDADGDGVISEEEILAFATRAARTTLDTLGSGSSKEEKALATFNNVMATAVPLLGKHLPGLRKNPQSTQKVMQTMLAQSLTVVGLDEEYEVLANFMLNRFLNTAMGQKVVEAVHDAASCRCLPWGKKKQQQQQGAVSAV